ncbi:hypothetical protein A2715_01100 [Candidatus Woesebacteria bacterium RIFCSPHIGHO2_01_FULL_39_32]|uniref:OmpR/PhoB-type domain-containing protein n=2 Tax=Candidatus Woeseibacteriota TaxID=1752722 RepID=A0A0G0PR26_9BACT|nr:MAG: hypothetical protein UT61_C0008G0044 [Candidatus Woesebacteria bacterium GW2011_GWA1_39_8]OGM04522.1 MAG: hypothetical protein A2124_05345 [Candidatus Woesebacteria bacterium GWB1_37_5]OGM24504.1 MAG: hypothetical protein A2715_01100 [Candidatus Woesebacteria bacterium RIFCSPHIGHO2_01_FULL_39_32]OGM38866.1 MAG: hypothetical protein A3F01_03765 [Candidatus Woesebacteria bacterium RIFCSPHIGHO2_12_FULL_38_11]OGM63810.1 MAG: hypothetical protein A2893_02435 [Candidatus Woesebacteria bacteri
MGFYSQELYKDFERNLLKNVKLASNLIILTVPGLGASYFIRKFLEKNKNLKISYITKENDTTSNYNILDLNFDKVNNALQIADEYFQKAALSQKFALVVNTPYILEEETFKSSYLSSHLYSTYFFKAREMKDSDIFALEINKNLSKENLEEIFKLSGGIGRFIKFFAINTDLLEKDYDAILDNRSFNKVLSPIVEVIKRCNEEILKEINLKDSQVFKSELLKRYFELHPSRSLLDIKVNVDLSYSENGELSKARFIKVEKLIIEEALRSEGVVTKEKVADFKWGKGSYDEYSDQAIGKTVQRLNKKLLAYELLPIRNVGYKLVKK